MIKVKYLLISSKVGAAEDHGNRIGVISPERIEHVRVGLDGETARLCGSKVKVRAIKEPPGMAHTIGAQGPIAKRRPGLRVKKAMDVAIVR